MSGRKTSSLWLITGIAVCAMLILLGGYLAGYSLFLDPEFSRLKASASSGVVTFSPHYRGNHRLFESLFAPAHWLDCHIRPQVWRREMPQ
jgi:hypothetical protein